MSQIARRLFGTGVLYYLIQASTALILVLAANTSFADFPRLASLLARDRFVPRQFGSLGERLVFSNGILVLAGFAALLIVIFGGDTHALIPLYAVGVFISFTLSQSGMVRHWWRTQGSGWRHRLVINGVGAVTTGIVTLVIAVTKFTHGAWIVVHRHSDPGRQLRRDAAALRRRRARDSRWKASTRRRSFGTPCWC